MPERARPRSPSTSPRASTARSCSRPSPARRHKGCPGAATIHSLIYRARESGEETPSFELWNEAPASKARLIVIDECSMVDAELARDLMSFGVPLLVLGDPAQLPPID